MTKRKKAPEPLVKSFNSAFKHSDYPGKNDGGPIKGDPYYPRPAPPPKA